MPAIEKGQILSSNRTVQLVLPQGLARSLSASGIDDPLGEGDFDRDRAHAYAKALATSHYENFHVGTWLLPKEARELAFDVYAYCRWSDDLGDETGDTALSIALLEWWREKLDRLYEGKVDHVVFAALARAVEARNLPKKPFADLIDAFIQDQKVFRYPTFADLLDYCTRSADPVGRLVLALLGYDDAERQALSDRTCTALQLANFWQDVENDLRRGRIYIPLEDMARFGVNEEDLAMPTAGREVRDLIAFECERARAIFREGLPLAGMVKGRARFDIELFGRGGLAILDAIAAQDHDVLQRRPVVTRVRKVTLLTQALFRGLFGGLGS